MSASVDPGEPAAHLLDQLRVRLKRMHRNNGEPSMRQIARRTGDAITHTTAHAVIRCLREPRWGPLELVVEALDGDVEDIRELWLAIREASDPIDAQGLTSNKAIPKVAPSLKGDEDLAPSRVKQATPQPEPISPKLSTGSFGTTDDADIASTIDGSVDLLALKPSDLEQLVRRYSLRPDWKQQLLRRSAIKAWTSSLRRVIQSWGNP